MSVAYGRGPKGKATRLHAQLVRARGRCERCGSDQNLQCAHIRSRRFSATRTDLTNAWCLCAGCHFLTGDDPDEFLALVKRTIGRAAFNRLKARSLETAKVDWDAEAKRLAGLWRDLVKEQSGDLMGRA